MERFEIHTNFTNTIQEVHVIPLVDLNNDNNLRLLKSLFSDPESLRPGKTKTALTEETAKRFAALAQLMRKRAGEPERVAHFLNRILFCLFAQDAKLLPNNIVGQVLEAGLKNPDNANRMLYNEKPLWLENAQRELDMAVAAAYGWLDYAVDMPVDALLARLFKLNLARAEDLFASPDNHLGEVKTNGQRTLKSPRKGELRTGTF
jgi:hypothetical protein